MFNAARTAQICTLGRQNSLSINKWHRTGGPTPQVKTDHSFGDNNVNILAREDRWLERRKIKLERTSLNKGGGLRHYLTLFTMQYWVPSTNSLTNIHTWAHLATETYMKAGWVNDPRVAPTTLKLGAHTCPYWICKDTPTQRLKACNSAPFS